MRIPACVPRADKTDRTVLRFPLPEPGFGVAVEDVLERGAVTYSGVRVSAVKRPVEATSLPSTGTLLSQVRKRPDQTLDQALAVVHKPIQDLGPMMLSLACDNRKVVAERDGTLDFDVCRGIDDPPRPFPDQWRLEVHAGSGTDLKATRHLHGDWLPMPVTNVREGSVDYRQTTFVAPVDEPKSGRPVWVRDHALGLVDFTIKNEGQAAADARLELGFRGKDHGSIRHDQKDGIIRITCGGRVLALIDLRGAAP